MREDINIIYVVGILGTFLLAFILLRLDYSDNTSSYTECVGPGFPIDYVVYPHRRKLTETEQRGEVLFTSTCAACHKLYRNMTGPALYGIQENIENDTMFYRYVTGKKRPYFERLKGDSCLVFPELTFEETTSILIYTGVE